MRRLDLPQIAKAVDVLGEALAEHQVSGRQKWFFRILTGGVVLILGGYTVAIIAMIAPDAYFGENARDTRESFVGVGFGIAGFGFLSLVPLWILNLGLVRKLWGMARARHRLGLNEALVPAFRAERSKHRLWNILTASLAVLALVVILFGTVGVMTESTFSLGDKVILLTVLPIVGLSFGSIHYVRRGMERLGVVERLYSDLQPLVNAEAAPGDVKIPEHDYEIIARLERNQITERREQSAARATHDPNAFGYAVQLSFAAQEAKDGLPAEEQNRVDEEILRLVREPQSEMRRSVPDTDGLHTVRVKDSAVDLRYRIDDAAQRIQIARIVPDHEEPGVRS